MKPNIMSNQTPKQRWGIVIQALIAILTALSGVFAGCAYFGS